MDKELELFLSLNIQRFAEEADNEIDDEEEFEDEEESEDEEPIVDGAGDADGKDGSIDTTKAFSKRLKEKTKELETKYSEEADKKVVYDDGEYDKRYLLENYDHYVLDLDTEEEAHVRHRRPMLRPNETLLSEVYLAADGTWRSIHERTILPVLYSAH